jgi:glycosyltransferase involved in cell wall biosynthesis
MVSVIVPNYNHAPYLKERIDSIVNQTYHDFELILLDDCSTDNSREILESYRSNPHVTHIVYNEQNGGTPFAQWYKGMQFAKGEWIWIAESDDMADLNFLEKVMEVAESHPECGVIYTMTRKVFKESIWSPECDGSIYIYSGEQFNKEHLLFSNEIHNVSMMVFRKELYKQVSPETFVHMRLCGDWMCYTQLCRNTYVAHINQVLSYYRLHNHNTSSSAEREGRTFLEGLNVLDSLVEYYHIPPIRYSRHWGRELNKYKRRYMYSDNTMRKISSRLKKTHPMVLMFYYIYELRTIWQK